MIGQLAGITNIQLLFTIFGLTATTMTFGWLQETASGTRIPTFKEPPSKADVPEPGKLACEEWSALTVFDVWMACGERFFCF
jgi:hypothetical protein